jgi:phage I-like protein
MNDTMKQKPLPTRVKLLGWGRNEGSNGPIIVDDTTAKVFAANQKAIGRERVQIDFEHNTVPGTPEYERTTEPRPVAGHSNLVCISGEGIFAQDIEWTPLGAETALNYEDVSLAPLIDKNGRVVAAHSWSLTHTGAIYEMTMQQNDDTK